MFGSQRWLCPAQLALVPRPETDRSCYRIFEIFHGPTPSLRRGAIMRFVSKSSTPRISKLNDAIHANLKKAIPRGLFRLGSPVSSRQPGELSVVIGIDVAPI